MYKHPTFVPGSHHIFAGGDRGAYLLDAESGEQIRLFEAPNNVIDSPYSDIVAVSEDGRYGAMHMETGNIEHIVSVWDLETGSLAFQSTHPTDFAVTFAFSKDSRYFAWGGTGNIAYVIDLHSGEEVIRLSHLDSVHAIDFSSENRFLLTSTGGDGVILWDLESGEIVRRFYAGNGQAGFVKFTEDGTFVLYSTFEDGLIYRQPVSPEELIESMCARLQRDLTPVERQVYDLDNAPTCPKFAGS
jgi:WD40 repeat protein